MLSLTHTISSHNKIRYETGENDYRYVVATGEIKPGQILLIEHCFATIIPDLIPNVIMNTPELFDNLWPREPATSEKTQRRELAVLKAKKNMFRNGGLYILGTAISRFNHSTQPNALVKNLNIESIGNFLYVIADGTISPGQEVTIWYGNNYFKESHTIAYNIRNIDTIEEYVSRIIRQYIKKDVYETVKDNQLLVSNGVYFKSDGQLSVSEQFHKNFKEKLERGKILDWLKNKQLY